MMGKFQIRTDLALEAKESCEAKDGQPRACASQSRKIREREIYTTTVVIETENGARVMGKPVGTYITLEAPNMSSPDEDYHAEISEALAVHIRALMRTEDDKRKSVLVVGLGNREVTPDALGPEVIGNLRITRHMIRVYGRVSAELQQAAEVSALVPGVMAQTGMETLEIIKGVVDETHPQLVIVIDALAARSTKRLNRTIQITDTGINPGSGVGNHRNAINEETLGVPVIAIGVPTVVDAVTIVNDTMEALVEELDRSERMQQLTGVLGTLDHAEKQELIQETDLFTAQYDVCDTEGY